MSVFHSLAGVVGIGILNDGCLGRWIDYVGLFMRRLRGDLWAVGDRLEFLYEVLVSSAYEEPIELETSKKELSRLHMYL